MVKILQKDEPILRQKAKILPDKLFGTVELIKILANMRIALHGEFDGVGLAAPQIGVPYRIFIVSYRILKNKLVDESHATKDKTDNLSDDLICINPVLTKLSKEKKIEEEGCLSVRPMYGLVRRSSRATIKSRDENGVFFTRGASGLLAQIFQHEIDHLDGILFIDKATNLREISIETLTKVNKK